MGTGQLVHFLSMDFLSMSLRDGVGENESFQKI